MREGRLLITGGAGFIGSHLCERALKEGYSVTCLDNFSTYYDPTIKEHNIADALKHPHYSLIRGDILDVNLVENTIRELKPDCIVHLAALAGVRDSLVSPSDYVDVDVKGTVHLLEAACAHDVKQFVFGSSSSVYGERERGPFAETDETDLQISPYATAKKAGELFCRTYARLFGIQTTVLRFFTVYGPRQRPAMAIHRFARNMLAGEAIPIYGDGSSVRDYTFVDDIVTGILSAVENPFDFEIINLGSGRPTRLNDLIEAMSHTLDIAPVIEQHPDQMGDTPLLLANVDKARRLLGYEPTIFLDEGISQFIRWLTEEAS